MAEQKYFDFDKYMEEKNGQGQAFIVKAFGKEYELPREIPYDIILEMQRMHKEQKSEPSPDDTNKLCHIIFGEETFNEWVTKGISLTGISAMIEHVMGVYMDDAGKAAVQSAETKRKTIKKP